MESFSLHDQQQAPYGIPDIAISKPRQVQRTWWPLVSVLTAFVIGGSSAYVAMRELGSNASHAECIDWSDDAGPDVPKIVSEFELGLDTVIEWFPENAQQIIANKDEIINHMVDITDPEPDSALRTLELSPRGNKWDFGVTESGNVNWEWRRLGARQDALRTTTASTTILPAVNCTEALADFMHSALQFVTGFVRFTIPHRYQFRIALVSKINLLNGEQYIALLQDFLSWVSAQGTKDKVKTLWNLMKKSWSTLIKFMFEWMVEARTDPWETMKQSVRMASQFAVWFKRETPQAFMGAVGLQYFAAHEMFAAGKIALRSCNATLSDLLDPRGLMNKTVLL